MKITSENSLYKIIQLSSQYYTLKKPLSSADLTPFLIPELSLRSIAKGNYITTINTPNNKLYFVLTGSFVLIRSSIDGKNTLRITSAPTFLGVDHTVLNYSGFYSDIKALEDCLVLEINKDYFLKSIKQNAELCFDVLHDICWKYYHSSFRYDQTLFYNPVTKLMIYILNHWLSFQSNQKKHIIKVTNSQIAESIGVSIRTYYRSVNKLKEDNFISTVSGNICVTEEQINHIRSSLDEVYGCY